MHDKEINRRIQNFQKIVFQKALNYNKTKSKLSNLFKEILGGEFNNEFNGEFNNEFDNNKYSGGSVDLSLLKLNKQARNDPLHRFNRQNDIIKLIIAQLDAYNNKNNINDPILKTIINKQDIFSRKNKYNFTKEWKKIPMYSYTIQKLLLDLLIIIIIKSNYTPNINIEKPIVLYTQNSDLNFYKINNMKKYIIDIVKEDLSNNNDSENYINVMKELTNLYINIKGDLKDFPNNYNTELAKSLHTSIRNILTNDKYNDKIKKLKLKFKKKLIKSLFTKLAIVTKIPKELNKHGFMNSYSSFDYRDSYYNSSNSIGKKKLNITSNMPTLIPLYLYHEYKKVMFHCAIYINPKDNEHVASCYILNGIQENIDLYEKLNVENLLEITINNSKPITITKPELPSFYVLGNMLNKIKVELPGFHKHLENFFSDIDTIYKNTIGLYYFYILLLKVLNLNKSSELNEYYKFIGDSVLFPSDELYTNKIKLLKEKITNIFGLDNSMSFKSHIESIKDSWNQELINNFRKFFVSDDKSFLNKLFVKNNALNLPFFVIKNFSKMVMFYITNNEYIVNLLDDDKEYISTNIDNRFSDYIINFYIETSIKENYKMINNYLENDNEYNFQSVIGKID